ncbi:MAG: DUF2461 domain-containing protein [Bacteroidales bacterium]|nr:DUF2461 domain-containing protein [Bacteroidales bacterium]
MQTILNFLTQLKANNNREWFQENKTLYEDAKSTFEEFVNVLILKIKEFDSFIDVNSAKECIFRIYRDVRFSKNKEPYKPNFGAYISKGGRKSEFAGYYIHTEPNASFAGGGIYCPQATVLRTVREDIFDNPNTVKEIIHDKSFNKTFPKMYGEKLKTAPRGFPKDFSDIDLLNYKSYTVIKELTNKELLSNNFFNHLISIFKTQKPFNDYLNKVISEI